MLKENINLQEGIKILGLMSGTSLDGLDLCFAEFKFIDGKWSYNVICTGEESYDEELKHKLATAQNMSAYEYALLDSQYGQFLGRKVKEFIEKHKISPLAIASHGHTIFHQPQIMFTTQIGCGAGIAANSGVDCICDFRTTDVALGGQGAPLVPVGDKLLFADYDYCLNMGGFSNISFNSNNSRKAYDISPVNYVLNKYMRTIGKEYDNNGELASTGKIIPKLLEELNNLEFYKAKGPKSLGREWVEEVIFPLLDNYKDENYKEGLPIEDKLATFCEHIAVQIGNNIKGGKVLLTGGGAFNKYLVERMQINAPQCTYIIPDKQTINFKEALIFAFLGVLYLLDVPNCMSSVTGAKYDCIGGAMYKSGLA